MNDLPLVILSDYEQTIEDLQSQITMLQQRLDYYKQKRDELIKSIDDQCDMPELDV